MPAIVALVAGNVAKEGRSAAYGLIAAAGAIAVAAGPLIGGAVTTFASWRWVFVGEVVIVVVILAFLQIIHDTPPERRVAFDGLGAVLSVVGLSPDRLRGPPVRHVGLGPPEAGRTDDRRRVAGVLARRGRPPRPRSS